MPVITLITDFGTRDGYVGAMKGVILARCPGATVVDIAHDIPPQDVALGALTARAACPHFPPGTVHVLVVDPGVGTPRALLAAEFGGGVYLAPDNGLLTLVEREQPAGRCVRIENPAHRAAKVSRTFHGRDVLAPAAASLASGVSLTELGPACRPTVSLDWPAPRRDETGRIYGTVVAHDRYGNVITNVPARWVVGLPVFRLRMGPLRLDRLSDAYGEVPAGEALAVVGSFDLLELAVRNGSLAATLGAAPGTGFEVDTDGGEVPPDGDGGMTGPGREV